MVSIVKGFPGKNDDDLNSHQPFSEKTETMGNAVYDNNCLENDPNELLLSALHYWHDTSDAVNKAKAFSLCRKAAEMGMPETMYTLGIFLYDLQKPELANAWIQKAAEAGNKEASNFLQKAASKVNEPQSHKFKAEAPKEQHQGTDHSAAELIHFFENGDFDLFPAQISKEKFEKLQNCAVQNNISAQRELFLLYYEGTYVEQNIDIADKWLHKMLDTIASGSFTVAANETEEFATATAYTYAGNRCMETEAYETANQYYQQGAGLGNVTALRLLGENYYFGKGTEADYETALEFLMQYLRNFDESKNAVPAAIAYYLIGLIYRVEMDDDHTALQYFCQGAEMGGDPASSICQYEAAMSFFFEDDDQNSRQYLMMAVDADVEEALIEAGHRCHYGYGGFQQSLEDAINYYMRAIEVGTNDAAPYVGLCEIMSSVENPYTDLQKAIEYGEYALNNCEFYNKSDMDVYIFLACAYQILEEYDYALAYAQKAQECGLDNADECYQSIVKNKRFAKVFGTVDAFMNSPIAAAIPNINIIAAGWKIGSKLSDTLSNKDVSGTLDGISDAANLYRDINEM